jgi:hypothetical protein
MLLSEGAIRLEKPVPETVPEADKVVNAPVEGVVAPTGALSRLPPIVIAPFGIDIWPLERTIVNGDDK